MAYPTRHLTKWLALAFLAIGAPIAASAQEAEAPAAAPPAGPESPWAKLCNADPATGKELCLTIQEIRADTGQFIASATVRTIEGEAKKSLITAVPPGMLIQPGLRVQIDDGQQYEMKYGICFPNACYGELEINDEFITALKGGGRLTVTTLNQQAKPVNFPMTLSGFTKAYDGAGLDQAAQQERQNELADALARRAESARQKLIEQQQKESGAN
ncbi:MAG TPA: invasion associated locus B family protein [Bauldia sp.]|nr:invasion associated locus B family protein [Bauldia sp.]